MNSSTVKLQNTNDFDIDPAALASFPDQLKNVIFIILTNKISGNKEQVKLFIDSFLERSPNYSNPEAEYLQIGALVPVLYGAISRNMPAAKYLVSQYINFVNGKKFITSSNLVYVYKVIEFLFEAKLATDAQDLDRNNIINNELLCKSVILDLQNFWEIPRGGIELDQFHSLIKIYIKIVALFGYTIDQSIRGRLAFWRNELEIMATTIDPQISEDLRQSILHLEYLTKPQG